MYAAAGCGVRTSKRGRLCRAGVQLELLHEQVQALGGVAQELEETCTSRTAVTLAERWPESSRMLSCT